MNNYIFVSGTLQLLSDLERLSDNGEEYVVQRTCVTDDQSVVCNSEVKRHLNLLQRFVG